METSTAELWEVIANDAGNPKFADLAELLRGEGKLTEAIEVCLAGLSANPSCDRGRLVLARVFLSKGYVPFAQREIAQLCRNLPDNTALRKLADKLGVSPDIAASAAPVGDGAAGEVAAEAELNFDDIELIASDKE